jgi:hypothetical protein
MTATRVMDDLADRSCQREKPFQAGRDLFRVRVPGRLRPAAHIKLNLHLWLWRRNQAQPHVFQGKSLTESGAMNSYLVIGDWNGSKKFRVIIVAETPGGVEIKALEQVFLPGRGTLKKGQSTLVPKSALLR